MVEENVMQILSDSTKSRVLHVREVLLYDAPELKTNNYYGPEHEMYRPVKLTIKWYDAELPQTVDIDGVTEDGKDIRRSFGRGAIGIPQWLTDIAFPEPEDKNGPFPNPSNWGQGLQGADERGVPPYADR